jgi:hypothetical protein
MESEGTKATLASSMPHPYPLSLLHGHFSAVVGWLASQRRPSASLPQLPSSSPLSTSAANSHTPCSSLSQFYAPRL